MGELSILAVSKAEKLSLKDETDKSRIPRGGTPAYFLFGLRGTYQFRDKLNLSVAIENISDIDYRIHGSGVNGPGRNFIFSLTKSF